MRLLVVTTAHHRDYDCQALLYEYFAEHPDADVLVIGPRYTDVTRGSRESLEEEGDGKLAIRRIYKDIPEMWQSPRARQEEIRKIALDFQPDLIWCWHAGNYPIAKFVQDLTGAAVVLYLEAPTNQIVDAARRDKVPIVLSAVRTHRFLERKLTEGDLHFLYVAAPAGVPHPEDYRAERKNRGIFCGSLGYGYKSGDVFVELLDRLFDETPMEEFFLMSSGSEYPQKIMDTIGQRRRIEYVRHATRWDIFGEIARSAFGFTTMSGEWPGAFPGECWALGTPVLSAAGTLGGCIDDLVSGATSIESLKRIYDDQRLYEAIQGEGFRRYAAEYSTEAVGERCCKIFRGLLEGRLHEVWEELRYRGQETTPGSSAVSRRIQAACQQPPAVPERGVTIAPNPPWRLIPRGRKLRIGLQLPKVNTFERAVWGDEVMAVGMVDAFSRLDEVEFAEVYDPVTIHDSLDIVIHFYPHPQTRFIPGACNIWWVQAAIPSSIAGSEVLAQVFSMYDGYMAAGPGFLKALYDAGVTRAMFLPMSANASVYRPVPTVREYAHEVAFCANANRRREDVEQYLLPLVDLGLAIYGSRWEDKFPELGAALKGPIHPKDVPALYSSSKIVLSVHTGWHRENDVPTSRLWEALSCGAFVISDEVPTARVLFGDAIVWTQGGDSLKEQVVHYLGSRAERERVAGSGRCLVTGVYGFDRHVRRILDFFRQLQKGGGRGMRGDAEVYLMAGRGRMETGKWDQALGLFNLAASIDPTCCDARRGAAQAALEAGAYPEALRACEQLVELVGGESTEVAGTAGAIVAFRLPADYQQALSSLATSLLDSGQADEALFHLYRLVVNFPDSADAHRRLGEGLQRASRHVDAARAFQKSISLDPRSAEAYIGLAGLRWEGGKRGDAIRLLQDGLLRTADNSEMVSLLASMFLETGDIEEAVKQYQRLTELRPDDGRAHNELGQALYRAGRAEEALPSLLRACSLAPHLAEVHSNLGVYYWERQAPKKAVEHMTRAAEIDPSNPDVVANCAAMQDAAGDTAQAIEVLRAYLEKSEDAGMRRELERMLQVSSRDRTDG